MALPVRLFAELALKSSTRCPRRRRAERNVKCSDATPISFPRRDNFYAIPIPPAFCGVAFFAPRLFPFASFIYDE